MSSVQSLGGSFHIPVRYFASCAHLLQSQEVQDRGMQVVNVDTILDGREPEIVGRAVDLAPFDAAAG